MICPCFELHSAGTIKELNLPGGVPNNQPRIARNSTDSGTSSVAGAPGRTRREVAALELGDVDWRRGEILICGKGDRQERLPLPSDVGEALSEYLLCARRPNGQCGTVFLSVIAHKPARITRTRRTRHARSGRAPGRGRRSTSGPISRRIRQLHRHGTNPCIIRRSQGTPGASSIESLRQPEDQRCSVHHGGHQAAL